MLSETVEIQLLLNRSILSCYLSLGLCLVLCKSVGDLSVLLHLFDTKEVPLWEMLK